MTNTPSSRSCQRNNQQHHRDPTFQHHTGTGTKERPQLLTTGEPDNFFFPLVPLVDPLPLVEACNLQPFCHSSPLD